MAIIQTGESQDGGNKKTKHTKFSEKTHFLRPDSIPMCAYQGVRNVCFTENLVCFVFLLSSFWDSSFCLIINKLSYSTFVAMLYFVWKKYITNLLKRINVAKRIDYHRDVF